jgi:hypothetical protein
LTIYEAETRSQNYVLLTIYWCCIVTE